MNHAQQLQRSGALVADELWVDGGDAPIPPRTRWVVTVAVEPPPILNTDIVAARHPFEDSRWRPVDRPAINDAVAAVRPGTWVRGLLRRSPSRGSVLRRDEPSQWCNI